MKVLIAGDYCDKGRVKDLIHERQYTKIFGEIKDIVTENDFRIVNFENPIVTSNQTPISKCGSHLKGDLQSVEAIKYAGFNICTLANNHILDQGEQCCIDTKKILEDAGLKTIGVGKNIKEASEVLYLNHQDGTLALINCCENEFSIATDKTAGANPLNPINQYYRIVEARKNADYVIVIIHGGHEHFQLPSIRMKELYRYLVDVGADVVINHHQHCYSGYEFYKGKPIVYGLGNFIFDSTEDIKQRHETYNYGYMVKIELNKSSLDIQLIPYEQCYKEAKISLLKDSELDAFFKKVDALNVIISNPQMLDEEVQKYYKKSASNLIKALEQYPGRILGKLSFMGLLPSLMSKGYRLNLLNKVACESHRDKLIYALKNYD